MMDVKHEILSSTAAKKIITIQSVQTLWSGYGEIKRYILEGGKYSSVIVKHIQLPDANKHPKGWNTALSHQRKLKSYQVERQWYREYAHKTKGFCNVPESYHSAEAGNELLLIMEDLDATGYPFRLHHDQVQVEQAKSCLSWLAHFHGKFMHHPVDGLWPIGSYWHLETRPDELEKMRSNELKEAAEAIDGELQSAKYQSIVHGDAKLANFCFSENEKVAAVDFQYVGKGCGMKDVAYFISSCFNANECEKHERELLNHYFKELELSLDNQFDYQEVKEEWGRLYRYAWADFYRFLDGWNPGHWKMHHYSEKLTREVLEEIQGK